MPGISDPNDGLARDIAPTLPEPIQPLDIGWRQRREHLAPARCDGVRSGCRHFRSDGPTADLTIWVEMTLSQSLSALPRRYPRRVVRRTARDGRAGRRPGGAPVRALYPSRRASGGPHHL